jgi:hypothetical protein
MSTSPHPNVPREGLIPALPAAATGVGRLAAALALLLAVSACSKGDPELVVVLQAWRNADHTDQVCQRARTWQQQNRNRIAEAGCEAVMGCQEMTPLITRCEADPMGELRAFEDALLAQAAAEAKCKGVRLVRLDDRNNSDPTMRAVLDKPHWQLSLDFQPGDPSQRWWMTDHASRATFPRGEGNPKQIADDICAIVSERGAKLSN